MSVQDLKHSVTRNFVQHCDVLEAKLEGDSQFIIVTGMDCSMSPAIQGMSYFSVVWIRLSLTGPPLSEWAGSSVVAIWGPSSFPDQLRQCRGDKGRGRVHAVRGKNAALRGWQCSLLLCDTTSACNPCICPGLCSVVLATLPLPCFPQCPLHPQWCCTQGVPPFSRTQVLFPLLHSWTAQFFFSFNSGL